MLTRTRSFACIALILMTLLVASLSIASAKTFTHGTTVWFQDRTIESGDDVQGDLDVIFGNVTCEDGAQIERDVRVYFGSFDQQDGCTVDGRVINAFAPDSVDAFVPWLAPMNDDFYAQNRSIFKKLGWDVVVLLAFLLFPLRVRVALDRVEKHPGLSGAAGAVAAIAAVPVAILLLLSIIGLPLIPLEIAALFAGLWIGNAAVALLIGRRLYELLRPHTTPSPLGALVLGLLVVTAAETLPVVGWAVTALVSLVGLGATLLAFVRETSFRSFTHGPPAATPPMNLNRPA